MIKLLLFSTLSLGHFALYAQSIQVTLGDDTVLDCSASSSLPASCVHPSGTRYLVNAFENYANVFSISPEGQFEGFAPLKEVKVDDQLLYAAGNYPGPGFPGATPPEVGLGPAPSLPAMPRSTHSRDYSNTLNAVNSLNSMTFSTTDPIARALLQEMLLLANNKLEIASNNMNAENIEVELEDGSTASCQRAKPSGESRCLIYHCQEPRSGFYVNAHFNSPGMISLNSNNQIQSKLAVQSVWNSESRDKPISEAVTSSPFSPMNSGYGSGSSISGASQQINRQNNRQIPSLDILTDPSLQYLLDPMARAGLASALRFCDAEQVEALSQGMERLRQNVADAQMVQLVELTNNVLTSRLINPEAIPDNTCRDGDTWYRGQSYDLTRDSLAISSPKTIDMETATRLFNEARAMSDISWNYKMDGCYARAHLMARRFEAQGIHVDKVWIKGDLQVPEDGIRWNYHVAPIVYVEDERGNVQKMVIDPSLSDTPVTVAEWSATMEKNVVGETIETNYPFPYNVRVLERTAIAFSNSEPYMPSEPITITEEDKMRQASETMERYLGYTQ